MTSAVLMALVDLHHNAGAGLRGVQHVVEILGGYHAHVLLVELDVVSHKLVNSQVPFLFRV